MLLDTEVHELPDDFAKRMNVSSIVLSTALSAPGIIERATAIAPLVSRSLAPGCVFSMFVRWISSQTRYLWIRRGTYYVNFINIYWTGSVYLLKCPQYKLSIWAYACQVHKPGVVVTTVCKEECCHLAITFVEQLDVVGLDRVKEHEDKMTVGNKRHPEGSCLP